MDNCKNCNLQKDNKCNRMYTETPLIDSLPLEKIVGRPVYLKLENTQPTGSFKLRGLSCYCKEIVKNGCKELVSSSGGNAGLSLAYIARKLGVKARIVVPVSTSKMMREKIQDLGAQVEIHGRFWDEAHALALELAKNPESSYVHPFDHPTIWEGHSTIVTEMKHQLRTKPSAIVTCVGGGGLICGILRGLHKVGWNDVPVLGMETIGADSFNASVKAGKLVTLPGITSIAKCLGATTVCKRLIQYLEEHTIFSRIVPDKEAVEACCKFADDHRILVQPACGATLAGVYSGTINQLIKEKNIPGTGPIVVIVCGGSEINLSVMDDLKKQFNI